MSNKGEFGPTNTYKVKGMLAEISLSYDNLQFNVTLNQPTLATLGAFL